MYSRVIERNRAFSLACHLLERPRNDRRFRYRDPSEMHRGDSLAVGPLDHRIPRTRIRRSRRSECGPDRPRRVRTAPPRERVRTFHRDEIRIRFARHECHRGVRHPRRLGANLGTVRDRGRAPGRPRPASTRRRTGAGSFGHASLLTARHAKSNTRVPTTSSAALEAGLPAAFGSGHEPVRGRTVRKSGMRVEHLEHVLRVGLPVRRKIQPAVGLQNPVDEHRKPGFERDAACGDASSATGPETRPGLPPRSTVPANVLQHIERIGHRDPDVLQPGPRGSGRAGDRHPADRPRCPESHAWPHRPRAPSEHRRFRIRPRRCAMRDGRTDGRDPEAGPSTREDTARRARQAHGAAPRSSGRPGGRSCGPSAAARRPRRARSAPLHHHRRPVDCRVVPSTLDSRAAFVVDRAGEGNRILRVVSRPALCGLSFPPSRE